MLIIESRIIKMKIEFNLIIGLILTIIYFLIVKYICKYEKKQNSNEFVLYFFVSFLYGLMLLVFVLIPIDDFESQKQIHYSKIIPVENIAKKSDDVIINNNEYQIIVNLTNDKVMVYKNSKSKTDINVFNFEILKNSLKDISEEKKLVETEYFFTRDDQLKSIKISLVDEKYPKDFNVKY